MFIVVQSRLLTSSLFAGTLTGMPNTGLLRHARKMPELAKPLADTEVHNAKPKAKTGRRRGHVPGSDADGLQVLVNGLPAGERQGRPADLRAVSRSYPGRGAGEAHRVKAACVRVFSYAIQSGIADRNPAADLIDVLKPVQAGHFAAIAADALPAFLASMNKNDARLFKPTRIALRLMLLVFVRTSELIQSSCVPVGAGAGTAARTARSDRRWQVPVPESARPRKADEQRRYPDGVETAWLSKQDEKQDDRKESMFIGMLGQVDRRQMMIPEPWLKLLRTLLCREPRLPAPSPHTLPARGRAPSRVAEIRGISSPARNMLMLIPCTEKRT